MQKATTFREALESLFASTDKSGALGPPIFITLKPRVE